MPDFIDCKFEENFIARLEQGINEITSSDFELFEDEENTIILNFNTRILNRELQVFKNIQNSITKSRPISASIKRRFGERFVPQQLSGDFTQARINTVQDLINFIIPRQQQIRPRTPIQTTTQQTGLPFPAGETPTGVATSSITQTPSTTFISRNPQVDSNFVFFNKNFPTETKVLKALAELDPNVYGNFSTQFPSIDFRLDSGPISTAEVDSLIRENGLDPRNFATAVERNGRNIFNLLEKLLSGIGIGLGIMGAFCSLLEDVYSLSRNQRDLSDTSTSFLENFQNVLGLINPSASNVLGTLQELIQLLQDAQEIANDIANGVGSAISLIGSAFGILMDLVNILDSLRSDTGQQKSSLQGSWDLEKIRDALSASDSRFSVTLENRQIGDINQDGSVNASDAAEMQDFIDGTASEQTVIYISGVLLPYLNSNAGTFPDLLDTPSADEPNNSNIGDMLNTLNSFAGKFGAGAGSGDFGIGKLIEAVGIAQGMISSIQGLANASKPVDIQGLFSQLEQIQQLASGSRAEMFSDFNDFSNDFYEVVEDALREAERLSVPAPSATTAETNQNYLKSLRDEYTASFEKVPESSKALGAKTDRLVNLIRDGIRDLAAVGVLEKTVEQLDDVIEQSAQQLRSKIGNYDISSLDNNGYNWNMASSFAKFAGHKAIAFNAASNVTTENMKDSVRGKVSQSAEKFQEKGKEEVEYVAFRFCKLAGEIERLYDEVTKPMESMINQFQTSFRAMSNSGNEVTRRAILAGAIRYDQGTMIEAAEIQKRVPPSITEPYINAAGELDITPEAGDLAQGILPPIPSEYNFPSYEQAEQGAGGVRYVGSQVPNGFTVRSDKSGPGVDPTAMKNLYKLAAIWPEEIIVTSAYRDPVHNANVGGSPSSKHISGEAFDIRMPTSVAIQKRVDFCNAAIRSGFTGILIYGTHIHIAMSNEKGAMGGGDFNYFALPGQLGYKTVG